MSIPRSALTFVAFLGFVAFAPLGAQQAPQEPLPDSVQAMLAEFSEKDEQLSALQEQALSGSPELMARQAEIQVMVESAMQEEDPQFEFYLDRLEALEGEAAAAQEAEDMEALMEAVQEGQFLQQQIEMAQMRALDRAPVKEAIEGFQSDLMDAMRDIEPEVDAILARVQELVAILSAGAQRS